VNVYKPKQLRCFSATQSAKKRKPITYAHEWIHNFVCYCVLCIVMPNFLLKVKYVIKYTSSQNVRFACKVKQSRMQSETYFMQSETRFGQHAERNSCEHLIIRRQHLK